MGERERGRKRQKEGSTTWEGGRENERNIIKNVSASKDKKPSRTGNWSEHNKFEHQTLFGLVNGAKKHRRNVE